MHDVESVIERFAGQRVLVLGEAMLDSYLDGATKRVCREAPAPIVDVVGRSDAPGGAANTAVNVASFGAQVSFLSVIGDDGEGMSVRQTLQQRGVSTEHLLVQPARRTLVKQRIVAHGQMLLRIDGGSTDAVDHEHEQILIERIYHLWSQCDAVIVSDYGYGILTPRLIATLTELQQEQPRVLAVDARNLMTYRHAGVTVVKPNRSEAAQLLGMPATELLPTDWLCEQIDQILTITGARIVAVTLDADGAVIGERGSMPYRTFAPPLAQVHAAGAGDTFLSMFSLALAAGAPTPVAADLAAAAATIVVSKQGTAVCALGELSAAITHVGWLDHEIYTASARGA